MSDIIGLIHAHFTFRKPCWMLCDINDLGFYILCVGVVWVDIGKIKLDNIGISVKKKAQIKYP